jgi:plastocyanin
MDNGDAIGSARRETRTLTTRRGFIAATSLGAVSLYGLWAAYDAAPFRILGSGGHDDMAAEPMTEAAQHAGHGAAHGPTPGEFRRLTEDFVAKYRLADGSVEVGAAAPVGAPAQPMAHGGSHGGHDLPTAPQAATPPAEATDVYLMAEQWSFEPALLRLQAGVPYRFRMMAVDAAHGASLQLGKGSHIIRLRRGALVERDLTFTRAGEYLVYCTVYCGVGHDRMSGKIIVV